ncbi:CheR family methyltransferase [Pontibacter sp. JAM-7]|uniref:CheR family methyltransferase n=1 Tax=Pontibacter sp. JAM-7 TaxID=3366581 RepID=UPI003AF8EA6F
MLTPPPPGFQIAADDFREFRQFLEEHSGILLTDNKQYLVQSRLRELARANQCADLKTLLSMLRRPGSMRLREQIVEAMTTHETLWFRDTHPFTLLQNKLVPELVEQRPTQPLRIWSAACATGQEPYSISMIMEECRRSGRQRMPSVEIVATDISTQILETAKRGEYEMLALGRGLTAEQRERFFDQTVNGSWQVKTKLRQAVRFQQLNLLGAYTSLGKFDVIFCRNVLIYFSSERKLEILRKLHGSLRPGGYLFLGASEFLPAMDDKYRMLHCRPGIVYQAL